MAIIRCPECNKKVSSEAVSCPKCGYPVAKNYKEVKVSESKKPTKEYAKKPIKVEPIELGELSSKDSIKEGIIDIISINLKDDETLVGILIEKEVIIHEEEYVGFKALSWEQKKELIIKIKNDIEREYSMEIKGYVVGVSNDYSINDMRDLKKLFNQTNNNLLRIINSSLGTLLDLSYSVKFPVKRYCVILDFQKNHCELLVSHAWDGVFEIISKGFTRKISEQGIVNDIVNLIVDKFLVLNNVDLKRYPESIKRVREFVEEDWYNIVSTRKYHVLIPYIHRDGLGWKDIDMMIDDESIDNLTSNLVYRLETFLKDVSQYRNMLHTVFAFGKISKLEIIEPILKERLGDRLMYRNNFGVKGICIQAGILSGAIEDILILDVLSNTISIVNGNRIIRMIQKGTNIPIKKSMIFSTAEDNQTSVMVNVVEEYESNQLILGTLSLAKLVPKPKGKPQIEITVHVDVNYRITVIIKDLGTEKSNSIVLD